MGTTYVDAYHEFCWTRELHRIHLPKPSTQRRVRRTARWVSTAMLSVVTFVGIAIVAGPEAAQAVAKSSPPRVSTKLSPRVIGHPHAVNPKVCSPGPPVAPPPPAITTLAWVAESSSNEIQEIDEPTGALVGSPITVGTSPKGVSYWRPATSSQMDPEVVATNSASNSVTVIDAVTSSVLSTISVPSSSTPTAVATSPSNRFALVVDVGTGKVSIINLQTDADQGELTLSGSANTLSSIAFSASGAYAYVTDPTQHHVYVISHTPGTSPYYSVGTTYTNSSYDFAGIGTDLSTSSSSELLATDGVTGGHLLKFNDGSGSLSAPSVVRTFGSVNPGAVSVAPGGATAYVIATGSKVVQEITVSGGADTGVTTNSSFTAVGALGLSADGATLLSADTATANVQGTNTSSNTATNETATDNEVSSIAPALAEPGSWDAYVIDGSEVDVVNTGSMSVAQTIADTSGPEALVTSPDGQFVYVINQGTPSVWILTTADIGTATDPHTGTISLPTGSEPNTPQPTQAAISPNGDTLLVLDAGNGAVDVLDLNSNDNHSTQYLHEVAQLGLTGSGISSTLAPAGIAMGADGTYAYVSEGNDTSSDGFAVLQSTGTTTTGYGVAEDDEGLDQGGYPLNLPGALTVDPNGEALYVWGWDGSSDPAIYNLPLAADGEVTSGTGTPGEFGGPTSLPEDVTFSPEDDLAFATMSNADSFVAMSEPSNSINYTSTITLYPGPLAPSPDGLYLGITTFGIPGCAGSNDFDLYDAGSGTSLGAVALSGIPLAVAFAPQASPQQVSTTELAGGADNPSESAVSSGMNDVVGAGTPSDAPGAAGGVDTATGAYSVSVDSMTVPDLGIPLDQTATYDSSRASTNNLLGYGWQSSYGITATQNSHSASTNPCAITFTQEDGSTVMFSPAAEGPYSTCPTSNYQPPGWAQASLSFQASCNGSDTCWVLQRDGMTKYYVDSTNGELVKVQDLNGNAVTITWGSHTGRCAGVTSTEPCDVTAADSTRKLAFSYPSAGSGTCPSGTYTCVMVTDPLGRTLTYVKNSSGDLVQLSLANGSETATYVFSYGSGHLVASWWDPDNQAAHSGSTTYATDVTYSSGVVTEVTAPPVASVAPLSATAITPTTTFSDLSFDGSTGNGTVLVQNPDFNQSDSEPGASQTLDTYADFELVSSVVGYGPVPDYGTSPTVAPNPSESAYPMRDGLNLMPSIAMNALAGTTVPQLGEVIVGGTTYKGQGAQDPTYDNGVVFTTYDAHGNALSSTDEADHTTTSTYNKLNEVLSSTDATGATTTNTYNSTGQLLTTISPEPNGVSTPPETSNFYNSNGTLCASRDAEQVATYGTLSSCVTAGTNATTYTYDSSGDETLSTVTDSSTQTSSTQSEYDSDGEVCSTLSPNGYAITGDRLTGCVGSAGAPYASTTVSRDVYGNPTETVSSLSVSGGNTFATSYACTDANGNTVASVGPMGSAPMCPDTSTTTSVDTTFTTYDPNGDQVQSIAPFAATGAQGPTSTSQFDADQSDVLDLSAQGYLVWVANSSAVLMGYETGTLLDDQGNTVATAPGNDLSSSCVANATAPCPDDSVTAYDGDGQQVVSATSGNGEGGSGSSTPTSTTSVTNDDSTGAGSTSAVGGGSSGVTETTQSGYNADDAVTNDFTEHLSGTTTWVTDSATSTAYAADGSSCWSAPTYVSSPTCSSPPAGEATVDYDDADGHVLAEVGPGGASTIKPGGSCNPETAVATAYTINTADLCAFTTYSVYNEAGQLTETIEPSTSNSTSIGVAAGITTTYAYDPSGNQTSEVNPAGNTVSSTYDGANRLVGVTYSDVGTTNCTVASTAYDTCYTDNADGTRSQMVDSTGTTTYSYDDAKDLLSVNDSNGKTVTYGYNSFGQESCLSYPGFSSAYDCLNGDNPNNGTNAIDPGEVWYSYDGQGRTSAVTDWNGDTFTYAYDCTGDIAWLAETPTSKAPTVSPCAGYGGTSPASPVPSASGNTFIVTKYNYSSGGSGGLLGSQTTSAVTHSGSTSLLEFDSIAYDDNNNLTSSTPKVSGTTKTADAYGYDSQQRVISGPETSGSKTAYSYTNSNTSSYPTCSTPYCSHSTVDEMGIDAMPEPGSTAQAGAEYAGNGELCWVGVTTTTKTGSCGSPSSTSSSYETVTYNGSGDMTATATSTGYGATSALTWNADQSEPTCINPSGSTCTGPSSGQPAAQTYAYDAQGLRVAASSWSGASVVTSDFTWESTSSALLSNGTFDYIYGTQGNVPIGQIDSVDDVTDQLITDPSSNVRGIVEVSSGAANTYVLANYTDYDAYGNPMTKSGGAVEAGGLTNEGESSDPDSATAFGFGGGYEDATIGLVYLVDRYFSPATGSFLSIDPDLDSTETPYAYAADSAANDTDYLGQCPAVHPGVCHPPPTKPTKAQTAVSWARVALSRHSPYYWGGLDNIPFSSSDPQYIYCTGSGNGTVWSPQEGVNDPPAPHACIPERKHENGQIGFDCSGLTMWVWGKVGVPLSHNSVLQQQETTPVNLKTSKPEPGDLVFYENDDGPQHVAIYVGGGKVIQAPHTGGVVEETAWNFESVVSVGRPS